MENKEEVVTEIKYNGVKKSKIVVARIIDFCILVIVSLITTLTVVFITAVTPGFNNILDRATEIQLKSHLYSKDKNDNVFLLTEILASDEEMKTETKNDMLDEALTYFFDSPDFFKENDGVKIYNDFKKDALKDEKHLFILDGEKYIENTASGLTPSVYYDFYRDIFNYKAFGYLQNNSEYHHLSVTVSRIFIIEVCVMPILSYLGLFFLVPVLSFKNHNTLGFKTYKIGIIDGNGFVLSTKKALGAATFSTLIVGLLSLATFFIPLFISMGFFQYRGDNKNLTGYLFDYYYVDITHQSICSNLEEYNKKEEEISSHSELYSNTPLENDAKNEVKTEEK